MPRQPLSKMAIGDKGYVVALRGGREFQQRLISQRLNVGAGIEVLHRGDTDGDQGPVAVRSGDSELTVGHGMAAKILVDNQVTIKDLQVGQRARVTGYATKDRDYRHKLLRMGMVKQAEFTLVRVAPLGDPVVIELRGMHLTLRKSEADGIAIEVITQP